MTLLMKIDVCVLYESENIMCKKIISRGRFIHNNFMTPKNRNAQKYVSNNITKFQIFLLKDQNRSKSFSYEVIKSIPSQLIFWIVQWFNNF